MKITNKFVFQVVVCGYTRDAIARVFSLPDGNLLHLLKCVPDGTRLGFCGGQVPILVIFNHSYLSYLHICVFIFPYFQICNKKNSFDHRFNWILVAS